MSPRAAWGDLRTSRNFRGVAQVVVICALVVAGVVFSVRIDGLKSAADEQAATTAAIGSMLAQTCGVASLEELRQQGLVEECRLAQTGELLDDALPKALPGPGVDPSEVDVDLIEDDDTSTPADIAPPAPPSDAQVAFAVSSYFANNPLSARGGYRRAVGRAVTAYLSANPPSPARPPTEEEVRSAVRTTLLANPPSDGTDGRGVVSAALDACDVVFTYSDGSTNRLGPVCGPEGEPSSGPTDQEVARAVVAYCAANGECRGPVGPPGVVRTADACQPGVGQYVSDVSISGPVGDPATITVSCETAALPLSPALSIRR